MQNPVNVSSKARMVMGKCDLKPPQAVPHLQASPETVD